MPGPARGSWGSRAGQWLATFKTTPWSAPIVIAISVAVAAAGLVLVLVEVRPQRKRHAVFATDSGDNWLLLRRSTEGYLQRRLTAEVPVDAVKVRLTPRSVRWRLKVRARAASATRPALQSAARDELGRLHAPASSTVEVATYRPQEGDMSDRRDRAIVAVVGFLLLVGGGLAACLGAGVFGTARSDRYVFDPTVARWWDEGGWESFAVVTAIGVVAVALGAYLALAQLQPQRRPPADTDGHVPAQ